MFARSTLLAVNLFGVNLIGVNAENGRKLLLSLALIIVTFCFGHVLRWLTRSAFPDSRSPKVAFWLRQAVTVLIALIILIGLISIWFDDPTRLATALGLVTAGLAFALQRVVTAFAGYLLILRGKTFNVGDRITLGGVRGDVIALGFLQTTIMEMGQPPEVQNADPAMWVKARQYSGRIVTVTNAKIFDEPVYNYTRDFPYLWEEMSVPVRYDADTQRAEQILLTAARNHTQRISELSAESAAELRRRFGVKDPELEPRVFWRLTDNWVELTVRFVVMDHLIRNVKDAMSREIFTAFQGAGLQVASGTYDVVGMPALRVKLEGPVPAEVHATGNGREGG